LDILRSLLFYACTLLQKSESAMEIFKEAGVPRKQKVTTFNVTDDAIIKPGNLFELRLVDLNQVMTCI